MYHSVTIGTKNTWADWRLIPSAPPVVQPPPLRKNFVELPGGNGSIDLTQFIGNQTHFGVIEGSWEFVITDQISKTRDQWVDEIASYLHGKRFEIIILEDLPDYYYSGRFEVTQKVGKNYSSITIAYTLDPFKKKLSDYAASKMPTSTVTASDGTRFSAWGCELTPYSGSYSVAGVYNATVVDGADTVTFKIVPGYAYTEIEYTLQGKGTYAYDSSTGVVYSVADNVPKLKFDVQSAATDPEYEPPIYEYEILLTPDAKPTDLTEEPVAEEPVAENP